MTTGTIGAPGQTIGHFNAKDALSATTLSVFEDELCFILLEVNLLETTGHTLMRYQLLRVVRNDHLETAYVLLGPASQFTANPIVIRGGAVEPNGRGWAVNTVGELREIADELRALPRHEIEPIDIQGEYREYLDQRRRFAKRESTYGYGGELIRSF